MSQTQKLYNLLSDGKPHRTDSIMKIVYGDDHLGLARVGARIWDIKNKYNVEIESWKDKETPSLWWYQMKIEPITSLKTPKVLEENKNTLFALDRIISKVSDKDILKYR